MDLGLCRSLSVIDHWWWWVENDPGLRRAFWLEAPFAEPGLPFSRSMILVFGISAIWFWASPLWWAFWACYKSCQLCADIWEVEWLTCSFVKAARRWYGCIVFQGSMLLANLPGLCQFPHSSQRAFCLSLEAFSRQLFVHPRPIAPTKWRAEAAGTRQC